MSHYINVIAQYRITLTSNSILFFEYEIQDKAQLPPPSYHEKHIVNFSLRRKLVSSHFLKNDYL